MDFGIDVVEEEKRAEIRQKISQISFEELLKLKEKMGVKLLNQTVSETSAEKPKTSFKRANKNRPREMSSKRRNLQSNGIIPIKKPTPRDPRFDPLCGTYEEKIFKENYKFVYELKAREKIQLQKEYQKEDNPKRKEKIKFLIQRLDNQLREYQKREKIRSMKKVEKEQIKESLRKGEKPVFKKKSEQRIESLLEKYEELKNTNKLKKYMERKSRKQAKKDRRKLNDVKS